MRCHSHVDGIAGEYYCWGRAQGLNHKNAYWAMVGALCSGTKEGKHVWTGPPKQYVALGKKKFPVAWFTQKTKKWLQFTGVDWDTLKAANPQWFGTT